MGDMAAAYGLDYRVYDSDSDKARQIPLIERARSEGATALIVCPLDVPLLEVTLSAAQSAGLPMVFMHSSMPNYGGVLISGDDYRMGLEAGRAAGEYVRDELGGQARAIVLDFPDLEILIIRANGLEDGILEYAPDVEIVGRYIGATTENGYASVQALLAQGIEFDVILSINDNGSFGAIDALEEAGVSPDDVHVFSIDAEALARAFIQQGYFLRGTVDVGRELFSRTAIDAMAKLLAGATVPEQYLVPPRELIDPDVLSAEEAEASEGGVLR
jgi:ribose transport system substrate-binding protein